MSTLQHTEPKGKKRVKKDNVDTLSLKMTEEQKRTFVDFWSGAFNKFYIEELMHNQTNIRNVQELVETQSLSEYDAWDAVFYQVLRQFTPD